MLRKNRHMSKFLDICSLYLSDYRLSFTGREIARRLAVNHQTALSILKLMVSRGILKSRVQGRNFLYSLNLDDFNVHHFLILTETLHAQAFLENFELKSVIKELFSFADAIVVFGSFAQNKQKESSDLDLVLVQPTSRQNIGKILHLFPREINVHYVTWKEFIASLNTKNHLALEIKKNHVIYGNVARIVETYVRSV